MAHFDISFRLGAERAQPKAASLTVSNLYAIGRLREIYS
jgi:hypothetical protein